MPDRVASRDTHSYPEELFDSVPSIASLRFYKLQVPPRRTVSAKDLLCACKQAHVLMMAGGTELRAWSASSNCTSQLGESCMTLEFDTIATSARTNVCLAPVCAIKKLGILLRVLQNGDSSHVS